MPTKMIRALLDHESTVAYEGSDPFWGYVGTLEQFGSKHITPDMSPALVIHQGDDKYSQPGIQSYFVEGHANLVFLMYAYIPKFDDGQLRTDMLFLRNNLTGFFFDTMIDAATYAFNDSRYGYPFEEDKFYPINNQYSPVTFKSARTSEFRSFYGDKLNDNWYEIKAVITFYFNNRQ